MGKKVAVVVAAVACTVPAVMLLVVVLLLTAAGSALDCPGGATGTVAQVPSTLSARTATGTVVTLDHRQLTRAATVISVADATPGVGTRGARIAVMAALTESGLRMLANASVPASRGYANDGVGADHDSLGMFQMRASTGWGSVAELMDPTFQARAFFGGPAGPNRGSPAGLLGIRGWAALTDGQAAQAVEVSAYPTRYANYGPVADAIIRALTATHTSPAAVVADSSAVVFPLPAGSWTVTARFGPRIDPITGLPGFHHGTDLAAAAGTPIRSATDGRVLTAGMVDDTGTITISTRVDGIVTAITYLHMPADGIDVRAGQSVTAGQVIGVVGSTGHSTGPHLHFQVQPGGPTSPAIDSLTWLRKHHATTSSTSSGQRPATCRT